MKRRNIVILALLLLLLGSCSTGVYFQFFGGDTEAPTLVLKENFTTTYEVGTTVDFAQAIDSVSDNTSDLSSSDVIITGTSFDVYSIGNHTVTYTLTDAAGNVTSDTITYTYQDTVVPTLTLDSEFPLTYGFGSSIDLASAILVASDNSMKVGKTDVVISYPNNQLVLGENVINYTLKDPANNETVKTLIITLVTPDNVAPTLTLDTDFPTEYDLGSTINFKNAILLASDNQSPLDADDVVISGNDFDLYAAGSHTVTYTLKDQLNNQTVKTIQITLVDDVDPVLTLDNAFPLTYEFGTNINLGNAIKSASDNSQKVDAADVVITPALNTLVLGENTITYTLTDPSNNQTVKTLIITLVDTTDPLLTLVSLNDVKVNVGGTFDFSTLIQEVSDNVTSLTKASVIIDDSSVNFNVLGDYSVKFTVKDSSNNETQVTVKVIVSDTQKPTLTLAGSFVKKYTVGSSLPELPTAIASVSDNVDILTVSDVSIVHSINMNVIGLYNVSFTLKDASNNETSETITIEIVDDVAPTLTLSSSTLSITLGDTTLIDYKSFITVSDNYDTLTANDVTIKDNNLVDPNTVGTYVVTYTVKDSSNNQTVKTLTITVSDGSRLNAINPTGAFGVKFGAEIDDYELLVIADEEKTYLAVFQGDLVTSEVIDSVVYDSFYFGSVQKVGNYIYLSFNLFKQDPLNPQSKMAIYSFNTVTHAIEYFNAANNRLIDKDGNPYFIATKGDNKLYQMNDQGGFDVIYEDAVPSRTFFGTQTMIHAGDYVGQYVDSDYIAIMGPTEYYYYNISTKKVLHSVDFMSFHLGIVSVFEGNLYIQNTQNGSGSVKLIQPDGTLLIDETNVSVVGPNEGLSFIAVSSLGGMPNKRVYLFDGTVFKAPFPNVPFDVQVTHDYFYYIDLMTQNAVVVDKEGYSYTFSSPVPGKYFQVVNSQFDIPVFSIETSFLEYTHYVFDGTQLIKIVGIDKIEKIYGYVEYEGDNYVLVHRWDTIVSTYYLYNLSDDSKVLIDDISEDVGIYGLIAIKDGIAVLKARDMSQNLLVYLAVTMETGAFESFLVGTEPSYLFDRHTAEVYGDRLFIFSRFAIVELDLTDISHSTVISSPNRQSVNNYFINLLNETDTLIFLDFNHYVVNLYEGLGSFNTYTLIQPVVFTGESGDLLFDFSFMNEIISVVDNTSYEGYALYNNLDNQLYSSFSFVVVDEDMNEDATVFPSSSFRLIYFINR